MTLASFALFCIVTAMGILPVVIVLQLRSLLHGRFYAHLWRLRDRLASDILEERVAPSAGAFHLLRVMETYIRIGGRHSLADALVAYRLFRHEGIPSLEGEVLHDGLSKNDRIVLCKYLEDFASACAHHLLASSPTGWLAQLWLLLTRLTQSVPDTRDQVVTIEQKIVPKLVSRHRGLRGRDPGPLLAANFHGLTQ